MPTSKPLPPQRADDRRASLRVRTMLPFQWQPIAAREDLEDLVARWGLAHYLETQQQLATIDGELERAMHDVRDPTITAVFRLINGKLDLIAQSNGQADARQAPRSVSLELSAEGLGFNHTSPVPPGSLLGVHLVLPGLGPTGAFHILCTARVTGTKDADSGSATVSSIDNISGGGHHLGVQFLDLSPTASRRLTRFVISAQSSRH